LIDVRTQLLGEEFTEAWIVIDASDDSADLSSLLQAMEGRVDC
jgi:hypothetical protein